jgi:alpha-L-fucosidase 2
MPMTTKLLLSFLLTVIIFSSCSKTKEQQAMQLWYAQPASQNDSLPYSPGKTIDMWAGGQNGWNEALPIGNGRMGAMIFGGVGRERMQLNEESLWDGFKMDDDNPAGGSSLNKIRDLVFRGMVEEASKLAEKNLLGIPLKIRSYQTLGDFYIDMPALSEYENYTRRLSLDSAITSVSFKSNGISYFRDAFASHPDQAIIIRLGSNQQAKINAIFSLTREMDAYSSISPENGNILIQKGQITAIDEKTGENKGIKFETRIEIINRGGEILNHNNSLSVKDADEVMLIIVAATNYSGKDPGVLCGQYLEKIQNKTWDELLANHVKDYKNLFDRVKINLGSEKLPDLPTDKLLEDVKLGIYRPYVSEILYQFGRYLLISSSREGDLPANLQGLWCQHLNAPWNSDYHTNINLEMNYWGAEVGNLAECHLPLFDLIDSVALYGKTTARQTYNANGWTMHHLTDIFWRTAPADGIQGIWPMGGAWLCRHLWEHYEYSGDREFLKTRAYPLMKGSAEFMMDFLVTVPKGLPFEGMLVTNPSHSPENAFEKADGTQSQFTYGATMDLEIIHDLFTNCIRAIDVLSEGDSLFEAGFKAELTSTMKKLVPLQISKKTGKLQEWIEDFKETELGHRHFSHLFAVFPGQQISRTLTPELADAAVLSIESRLKGNPNAAIEEANNKWGSYGSYLNGEGGGNWQRAWLTALWARFYNSEKAFESHLKHAQLLNNNLTGDGVQQLDGSFGIVGSISEMLIQSHEGFINPLPALPTEWKNGFLNGVRVRGGFVLDMEWEYGKIINLKIISKNGSKCRLKLNGRGVKSVHSEDGKVSFENSGSDVIEFSTLTGSCYSVIYVD